ncbi:MAG: DUF4340 domain-containing protein [Acidobacteria bacterium]|nr:DUF4340 domain-containing protein [Acidobacteriota bacterium]
MRFRVTWILLVICAALGAYVYFYEIRGGEKREKQKQEENRIWKLESNNIQQIELITPEEHVTLVRKNDKEWKITAPRALDADSDELNRMAGSAADISRESVLEAGAKDLARYGLEPAQVKLFLKTKDGKDYRIRFGSNNPTGNSTYAALEGKNDILLVASYVASSFRKKLEDLRNRAILNFEQYETQSLDLQSAKGNVKLVKENDKWWLQGKDRWAADSSAVNGVLSALSSGRLKEFFEANAEDYSTLGFERPLLDVRITYGKDRALKHLTVGLEKSKLVARGGKPSKPEAAKKEEKAGAAPSAGSELYIARDESRTELFFVDKEFVDKVLKAPADLRDKALASFQRWDIDSITLTNTRGTFSFSKTEAGGDWVLGDAKKKTKWDAVNGILDALEKPVKSFIDAPAAPSAYGLDSPAIRVVLKQKNQVKLECAIGKETKEGVYAQVKGESSVKVADKDSLDKLTKGESDFLEPPPPAPTPAAKDQTSK